MVEANLLKDWHDMALVCAAHGMTHLRMRFWHHQTARQSFKTGHIITNDVHSHHSHRLFASSTQVCDSSVMELLDWL